MSTLDIAPTTRPVPRWVAAVDRVAERLGDKFNPILVKEARQALKSKQFIWTFSLLLVAAWMWTAAAIMLNMPDIYYTPSGASFLAGYYLVLAVPMLLVVPLAAHRSLASEVDDGTLDLLSVTSLSPLQIITGKLASAALQMMLYLVALFPCVAFCYVLRGVDLMTIAAVLGMTVVVASVLTVIGLFLAALPGGRTGQLGMLVLMLVLIVFAEFMTGGFAMAFIMEGWSRTPEGLLYYSTLLLIYAGTLSMVLLRAAAAELSPPSENRSTPIRRALLWHQFLVTGAVAYGVLTSLLDRELIFVSLYFAALFWTIVGALMVGESSFLTPRVRRGLPASFLSRSLFVWNTPGPSTGLVFPLICFWVYAISLLVLESARPIDQNMFWIGPYVDLVPHALALSGYIMLILATTRGLMYLFRRKHNPRPLFAWAVLVIVAALYAMVPYFAELHLNDYRAANWSIMQLTNWVWTLAEIVEERIDVAFVYAIFIMGGCAFAIALFASSRTVLPLRVETPERVLKEKRHRGGTPAEEPLVVDPLY